MNQSFDGMLYVNARGWKLAYNAGVIVMLYLTKRWRGGHWYFSATSFTEPKRK